MKFIAIVLVCLAALGYIQAKPVYKNRDINDKDVIEAAEHAALFLHEFLYLSNYMKLKSVVGAQSAELSEDNPEQWHEEGTYYKVRGIYGETNCNKDEVAAKDVKDKCDFQADTRYRKCYAEVHRDTDGTYDRGSSIVACKFEDE